MDAKATDLGTISRLNEMYCTLKLSLTLYWRKHLLHSFSCTFNCNYKTQIPHFSDHKTNSFSQKIVCKILLHLMGQRCINKTFITTDHEISVIKGAKILIMIHARRERETRLHCSLTNCSVACSNSQFIKNDWMCIEHMRISCTVCFKLNIKNYMTELGNTAPVRHFGLPPTKKMIHKWRRQEKKLWNFKKLNSLFIHIQQNGPT